MTMTLVIAGLLGAAFGAMLDRIGATNPNWIGRMLTLTDTNLMKTILVAIGTAAILLFAGQIYGLVDVGHMSVKAAHVGVLLGGAILGFGWAIAGYCPGTGLCALAVGRIDALFFVAGGLVGAAGFMISYPFWESIGFLNGEKWTLGAIPGADYPAAIPALPGDLAGIAVGAVFILIAILLPRRITGRNAARAAEAAAAGRADPAE
ncbi:YeeE/YedE family protein [Rhodovulum sulfidophilum]|uniref:DUF6691 family protein n=1 Tax=Rhodovulum sulfidophilum TaxID=35806 RepID=UPI0019232911|nr:DUF6691 family protein [Rhodovulum sulfidophilum]MBL3573062.1 YeeE/YedE family protein [Rhodovulum sulfidophilum]MCE8430268.1 YeeE/YedE family protein [Rhodovulum sulfidophilum]MCF4116837.1 YeeE/YedE family protein [Rhodovulum sulfidophilum]